MKVLLCLVLASLFTGCSLLTPGGLSPEQSSISSRVLRNDEGTKQIYFEQSDRVPSGVIAAQTGATIAKGASVPAEFWVAMINSVLGVIPEVANSYSEERRDNALISRKMLVQGYEGEELAHIEGIFENMDFNVSESAPKYNTGGVDPLGFVQDDTTIDDLLETEARIQEIKDAFEKFKADHLAQDHGIEPNEP